MQPKSELSHFLRSRRARIKPDNKGLRSSERRRTPGLRREEVAARIGVSTEWYTKIEQGRVETLSDRIVSALGRALELDKVEVLHLQSLTRRKSVPDNVAVITEGLIKLIQGLAEPAYITNAHWDVLVWNSAAADLITDFSLLSDEDRNILIFMLTTSEARTLFGETWHQEAQRMLGLFHADYDRNAHNPAFQSLITRLEHECQEFSEWWNQHVIAAPVSGVKCLTGKDGVRRTFSYSSFMSNDAHSLKMSIYVPGG
ncbi:MULTISPECIES: helix-turn-helix transcriptional regulator [Pantoea]|uniref:helix-turn-helix transcriptional regulator n=1 Tax=Pantoea TaxID=53335 RepID=UPI00142DC76F|nr:helix-turn-helix transcriptional regulator [Pantoea sp. EKM10T]KAF6638375.1 helix-turn-helix domain-containing protein [Pantoea sp. EKM10T]